MGQKTTFTCQNSSCKRAFTTPLKTLNLKENATEPYYACPFCLTRIEETLTTQNDLSEEKEQKSQTVENLQKSLEKIKPEKNEEKASACKYYLGYLSEREQKDKIPDDCMICKNIVDCMLKRMRE